jgi:BirA family transcriptional regulator, biotin operon repressor / biotin---[acetyl-CoA-carboxylase] ligase
MHPGRYDGLRGDDIADGLALPHVVTFDTVGSTLDVAHALAEAGAAAGTLVLADAQSAGRGRHGRSWQSEPGAGIWLTLVERPSDPVALDVLSLRVGLALAPVLDAFAESPVRLKWPNDLYVGTRKLGGILVEARWQSGAPQWVAIGVGVNVRAPRADANVNVNGAGLRSDVKRLDVLEAMVPAIRAAAARTGALDDAELQAFAERDLAAGLACTEPVAGTVRGIDASGALVVDVPSGDPRTIIVRAGSLLLENMS